nr:dihydrolipoyllysine residue acetyltransferase [Hymenolepis microstoma]
MLVLCIGMPNLSPTMEQGKILKWVKNEGDTVEAGDVICQVQTDKAVMDMEFEEEGVLAKIVQKEGSESKVGEIIAILAEPDEDWQEVNKNADAFIASLK